MFYVLLRLPDGFWEEKGPSLSLFTRGEGEKFLSHHLLSIFLSPLLCLFPLEAE